MSEEITFKVGDKVRLKSGGPDMTVDGFVGVYNIRCKWFIYKIAPTGVCIYKGRCRCGDFHPDCLTKV